jgi:hypothetical protein
MHDASSAICQLLHPRVINRTMQDESMASLRVARWGGVILIIVTALLYASTLDNGLRPGELEGGDLITHQYAQVQARPSNAPGYPLYTMGGWLWFHTIRNTLHLLGNPLPNPIPILSSYSTLWALIAIGLLYLILLKLLPTANTRIPNWPLAWLICVFYAVTAFFWYYATTTEQYSSAVAHTLTIVYVYLLWRDAAHRDMARAVIPGRSLGFSQADWLLILLAFLCGLSLAHMLTVAFIVPPLLVAILWERPTLLRNVRLLIATVFAALLPLVSYIYVYIRGAAHPEWWGRGNWPDAWSWFWSFVSTSQGRQELGWSFEAGRSFFGNGFPELIWHELSILLLVLGLAGIVLLPRPVRILFSGTLAIYLVFCWIYRFGNWFQVILPVYPLVLVGAALAIDRMQRSAHLSRSRWLSGLPLALLVMAIVWRTAASFPQANSRDRTIDTTLDRAALLLNQPLPPRIGLFATVVDAHALDYLINIWGIRPDLRVVSSEQAGQLLSSGQSVLSTWEMAPTLLSELPPGQTPTVQSLTPDWAQLSAEGTLPVVPDVVRNDRATDELTLVGYSVMPAPNGAPVTNTMPAMDVTIFWRLENGSWPQGLAISVRPTLGGVFLPRTGTESGAIIQQDSAAPMHGLWEAAHPTPGSVIADAYRLLLPAPLPAGADGVTVILYRATAEGFQEETELHLAIRS